MSDESGAVVGAVGSHDLSRAGKDIAAGTCGGIAQVLVGQPFDTVKVRLQTQPAGSHQLYKGALDCVRKIWTNEGLAGFYKGTATPLVGIGACVSVQFGTFEFMKRWFSQGSQQQMSARQFYISGAIAGLTASFICCPVEHIRIRLQTQASSTGAFHGPLDAIRKIYIQGGIRSLYRGLGPTFIREGNGMGMYFLTYEYLIGRDLRQSGGKRSDIPAYKLCLFGALSGEMMWLTSYPVDVIKSRLQTDSISPLNRMYKSSLDCFKQCLASEGIKGFFKGFVATMLRAGPVNAATFVTFEAAMRYLE